LRIINLTRSDNDGGASIAAYRIHSMFNKNGQKSNLLVVDKKRNDFSVIGPKFTYQKLWSMGLDKVEQIIIRNKSTNSVNSLGLLGIQKAKYVNQFNPDIVNLHWINAGLISLSQISKIESNIFWTLHDSWAFSGISHLPQLQDDSTFLSPIVNYFKRKVRDNSVHFISPSNWIDKELKKSEIFGSAKSTVIHNPLDSNVFKPIEMLLARKITNLQNHGFGILFSAFAAQVDANKGLDRFLKIYKKISESFKDVFAIIIGVDPMFIKTNFGEIKNVFCFPQVKDDTTLMALYNSANITFIMSRLENLSQVAVESLACETPVITFDVGGMSDAVLNSENGFLIEFNNLNQFYLAFREFISNPSLQIKMNNSARRSVILRFDQKVIFNKYIQAYQESLML
jgi:glycosyltransferase involved in cell wall biosynthesis